MLFLDAVQVAVSVVNSVAVQVVMSVARAVAVSVVLPKMPYCCEF